MIKYRLQCSEGHQFDEWFKSMGNYDERKDAGELVCPECGDAKISKALMAPSVGSTVGKPWQGSGPSCSDASSSCASAGCPMANAG